MFFYLTNVVLDVTLGAAWWILKTTGYLVYNGVVYLTADTTKLSDQQIQDSLQDSIVILDKEEFYDLLLAQKKNIEETSV